MTILILSICLILYFIAMYTLIELTLRAFQTKRRCTWMLILLFFCTIPMFCVLDYIHRGNLFIEIMATLGYFILAFLIYYMLSLLAIIMVRFIYNVIKKQRTYWYDKITIFIGTGMSIVICLMGILCAQIPVYKEHHFHLGLQEPMKALILSDIHYQSTGSMLSLKRMVEQINQQTPDIVFLVGDVFDNHIKNINKEQFIFETNQIQSKYGVYVVTGNHEFINNSLTEIEEFYIGSQIHLLIDEEVQIANQFRIYGRMDYKGRRENNKFYLSKSKLPLIVLDHQPQFFREAKEQGAVLQFSGHTHNGQIFPGNLLLFFLNQILYKSPSDKVHQYDDFTLSITRGYGTWGFPMRLTGASQIMIYHFT